MGTTKRKRLPFWRSVGGAYVLTFRNLGFFARILWAWLLLTMIPLVIGAYALDYHLTGPSDETGGALGYQVSLLLMAIVSSLMLASIAVAWHRKILAGESVSGSPYLRLDRVVFYYLWFALLAMSASGGAVRVVMSSMLFLGNLDTSSQTEVLQRGAFAITAVFILCYFIGTWLALPARALDHSHVSLWHAWEASRGNVWQLSCGVLLCGLPAFLLAMPLLNLNTASPIAALDTGLKLAMTVFVGLPVLAFLSLAYRELIGEAGEHVAQ